MTVFASVIDLLAALEHFRRVLCVCRTQGLGRGVMQAMRKSDPCRAVLINQCFDLVGLKLDPLIVLFSGFRNVSAG
ncbi:MAG TPA: hypothetical protein VKR43_08325, partial [Bryobacteraceae bacterium]|nr:hypothetical protein [Bryobacteraceae bacterium]